MSSVQYLINKTLGKYQILEHIGHGGMSEVYKGQQAQLNRMVAVKVLHPFLADEEGFVVRFQREARIVATLRHPNIVQVYDFDYHDELAIYYMVMEYIDGPTLKNLLENGPLPPEDAIRIGSDIADALDYAHQRSMVHRDIKPANIMFIDNKEAVLTDFGIARMLNLSGLTASGAMVGTPAYMAPEIGTGKAGAASSDIYSLSVVLYQAVTGNLPFVSETPMGMVMDHINKAPPRPSIFTPDVPEALEQVILRGMEKEPTARFSSAGEMASALRRILNPEWSLGPVVSLSPSTHGTPPPKQVTPLIGAVMEHERQPEEAFPAEAPPNTNDRLVKSWSLPAAMPAHEENSPPAEPRRQRRHKLLRAPAVWLVLLIVMAFAGSGIWVGFGGSFASFAQALRTLDSAGAVTNAVAPTVGARATITAMSTTPTPNSSTLSQTGNTPTPRPSPTLGQSPTATPDCSLKARLEQVNITPNKRTAPQGPVMTYLTLRNSGKCVWPAGTELRLVGDTLLDVPERLAVKALDPGEIVQVLFPLTAPEELGIYEAQMQLYDAGGHAFGGPVKFEVIVEDIPLPTSTQAPAVALTAKTPQPLTVGAAVLVRWEDQPTYDRWIGILELAAEGGSGSYRYYKNEIRETNEVIDGKIAVVGKRCEPVILDLWVLSGDQYLNWQEKITFPAPERCQ